MKKIIILLTYIFCMNLLSSCGFVYFDSSTEKEKYHEAVISFVTALDEKDSEAIYDLFALEVKEQDEDLKEQIDKLLTIYQGQSDGIGGHGVLASDYDYNHGYRIKKAYTYFPIRCGKIYYWCYLDLMYENTYGKDLTGIVQLDFYTADEFCIVRYDEDKKIKENIGLTVHAGNTLEQEVRCIGGYPYMYSNETKPLDINEVKEFFKTSKSFSKFKEQFGNPNAEHIYYQYSLPDENGEHRYLQISDEFDEEEIYLVAIVNDFLRVETIYDKYQR